MDICKLPHLAVRPPTNIAIARSLQIDAGKLFEATRAVEARGQFVSERFVVNEAVVAGGADGLFKETLRVKFSALEAGDFGAGKESAIREALRAILRPQFELLMVGRQRFKVPLPFFRGCQIPAGRVGQCCIELVFRRFE